MPAKFPSKRRTSSDLIFNWRHSKLHEFEVYKYVKVDLRSNTDSIAELEERRNFQSEYENSSFERVYRRERIKGVSNECGTIEHQFRKNLSTELGLRI